MAPSISWDCSLIRSRDAGGILFTYGIFDHRDITLEQGSHGRHSYMFYSVVVGGILIYGTREPFRIWQYSGTAPLDLSACNTYITNVLYGVDPCTVHRRVLPAYFTQPCRYAACRVRVYFIRPGDADADDAGVRTMPAESSGNQVHRWNLSIVIQACTGYTTL